MSELDTPATQDVINVLVVDDHRIVRAGICSLLSRCPRIMIVGVASSGKEAIDFANTQNLDIILMDIKMPGEIDGLEATKIILAEHPQVRIIILTVCDEEPFPSILLQSGASGYLTKGSDLDEMLNAIFAVHASNRKYIDPEVSRILATRIHGPKTPLSELEPLELQIMLSLVKGHKANSIIEDLGIDSKTLELARYRLYKSFRVDSDVELTHVAFRLGLIEPKLMVSIEDSSN